MKRKYQELYEAMKKMEKQGRTWCKIYAPVLGIVIFVLTLMLAQSITTALSPSDPYEPRVNLGAAAWLLGLALGGLAFAKAYAYGKRLILEAQRTLVLADTERNTAEIAELLRQGKQPEGTASEAETPAEPEKVPWWKPVWR